MTNRVLGAVFAAFLGVLPAGAATAIDRPTDRVVLVISGDVADPDGDGKAEFDLAMLEKLDGRTATMETPWTKGKTTFSGPLLRNVLKAAGADGSALRFKALNGYEVMVPVQDAYKMDTILATRMDGKLMSVRDKGPLFLVYPFDKDSSLYTESYFARSIWQISEIEIVR